MNISNYKIIELTEENKRDIFKQLYDNWAITIVGLVPEEVDAFVKIIDEYGSLEDNIHVVHILGKDMNEFFGLIKDPYPDNLNIYSICCKYVENINGIVIPIRSFGMRWFTDIVDNNAEHESNKHYIEDTFKFSYA